MTSALEPADAPTSTSDGDGQAAADALTQSLLQDPEIRAGYDTTREQLNFFREARDFRKRRKLSQQKIAELMGTSQSAVSDLESGRVTPNLLTLERYAQALGGHIELRLTGVATPLDDTPFEVVNRRIKGSVLMNLWRDGITVSAMANATTWPEGLLEPILSWLKEHRWADQTVSNDQPAYTLNKNRGHVIGLYLRRDKVVAVLQNLDAEVSDIRTASPLDGRRGSVVRTAAELVAKLASIQLQGDLVGVGATLAGPVNTDTGVVEFAPDLRNADDSWEGVPLRDLLVSELALYDLAIPVAVENDANAVAVREYMRRYGKYVVAIVLSGGGIGVGAVRQSKGLAEIYHGAHFRAGEGGHTTVDPNGPKCRAGFNHQGCLETMASAQGCLSQIGIVADSDREIDEGLDEANDRLRGGDMSVQSVFELAGLSFGRFLASAQAFLDPDVVVVAAQRQLVSASSPCGSAFRAGVKEALRQAAVGLGREEASLPLLDWEEIERDTYATGAGAAAWRFILAHPDDDATASTAVLSATASS